MTPSVPHFSPAAEEPLPLAPAVSPKALRHPHFSPFADEQLVIAPALSSAHCPLCIFQSAFWQPAPQYAATVHTEHFFSGTPVVPHVQQLFLGGGGSNCWEAASEGKAVASEDVRAVAEFRVAEAEAEEHACCEGLASCEEPASCEGPAR